jgi:hypothetical protein
MKKTYLVLLLTLISSLFTNVVFAQCEDITVEGLTNPGPFEVETLTEADGIHNGADYYGATIYYPTNATPPFASIAIVPGYTALPSSIEEWGPFYASHGIVTIIIGTNSVWEWHEARATALLDALETIKLENARVSSPLYEKLNLDQLAVSGWSMGGGGAQIAAVRDPSIKAVVALCPHLSNPQFNNQTTPVLIFSGENDGVAAPSQHADIHYNTTPNTTDKLLFEIENGDHYVANSPTGGGGLVGQIALSWLKLYVEGNNCYFPLITDNLLINTTVPSKIEQSFGDVSLGINQQELTIGVYPNPTKNTVNIKITEDVHYELFSTLGQRLLEGDLTGNNKQIDLSQLPTSLYYLHIEGQIIKLIKYD